MIDIHIEPNKTALGKAAADCGAEAIRAAIAARGAANIVVATGTSQFDTIMALVQRDDIDWSRVTGFHLDEYVGLDPQHPASFRRYLRERLAPVLPQFSAFYFVEGDAPDLRGEIARLNQRIAELPIDVTFAGIGENAHIAFNDPPADFEAEDPYLVVDLDERCRNQQLGEGWFPSLDDVPLRAVSMSVRQIMKAELIVLSVPDRRKAEAVKDTLQAPISPAIPASILRQHPNCQLFIDPDAASLL